MNDVHLKANQSFYKGDGDVGVKVVSSPFKHRMSWEKKKNKIKSQD